MTFLEWSSLVVLEDITSTHVDQISLCMQLEWYLHNVNHCDGSKNIIYQVYYKDVCQFRHSPAVYFIDDLQCTVGCNTF